MQQKDNGIYYFLGNITSHILHALPLYRELGGTFVVLSDKAKREVEQYGVAAINLDNKPNKLQRFGPKFKRVYHYLIINKSLKKTTDFLNTNAKVVLFYELYDFSPDVRITKPETVFLTHGNMLKDYMSNNNRLEILKQYSYMASMGPYMKQKLLAYGVEPSKLIEIGIARTDEIVKNSGKVVIGVNFENLPNFNPDKKIIAYLPTFWGPSSISTVGKDIVKNFPDNYTLIFRPHPQTPRKILREYQAIIENKRNVIYAPEGRYNGCSLIEIFNASSAIIGDVSSVMLEALLTKKPLIFADVDDDNHQSDNPYIAIKDIVNYSQKIDTMTVNTLDDVLARALSKGVDEKMWEAALTQNFFTHNGDAVRAIAKFIRRLL